jgi:hypothetical protein
MKYIKDMLFTISIIIILILLVYVKYFNIDINKYMTSKYTPIGYK